MSVEPLYTHFCGPSVSTLCDNVADNDGEWSAWFVCKVQAGPGARDRLEAAEEDELGEEELDEQRHALPASWLINLADLPHTIGLGCHVQP